MSLLETVLKGAKGIPFVGRQLNKLATNRMCNVTSARPRAFSLWSHIPKPKPKHQQGPVGEYTTWPMLTDRLFSLRHLPPAEKSFTNNLPADALYSHDSIPSIVGDVTDLFTRKGEMREGRSSILLMFFAQWFTDSILRIDSKDRRKNTSNHNIDLCQIYGLNEATAKSLRSGFGGKLSSQKKNGEEYLDSLGELATDGQWKVKTKYEDLPYANEKSLKEIIGDFPTARLHAFYATGLERGNSSVGYVAISTLFMREHNRICDELAARNPDWQGDDERLFQTARVINIVLLMKLVIQDYINHMAGADVFAFDTGSEGKVKWYEKEKWYRPPWIALEFDLLYRWHGLVPDRITIGGRDYNDSKYRFNNALLEEVGLTAIMNASSQQPAGKISLQNVPSILLGAEYQMIKMGRDFRLRSYNEYRQQFSLDFLTSFDELTDDVVLRNKLKALYGNINNVEFVVGLFAQKHAKGRIFGDLLHKMVAYDAFTQIYTNPLLSQNVYTSDTFTQYGLDLINETNSVQDLFDRNGLQDAKASFGV